MKKIISILLVFCLITALVPAAFAAETDDPVYKEAYATGHEAGAARDGVTVATARTNPAAAYDEPDAAQNGAEDKFFSLRQVESITYTFHPDENYDREIVNYRGDDAAIMPDLSLIEVTWGTWHVEAVDVFLIDAVVKGVPVGEHYIGTAFNKIGIDRKLNSGDLTLTYTTTGNFGYTNIFFPDDVDSAMGVKLVDVTTRFNTPPSPSSYTDTDDGYDLDAICAWYTRDIPVNKSGTFSIQKMVETDDGFELGGAGFAFKAYAAINEFGAPSGDPVATAETNAAGVAVFTSDSLVPDETYYVFEEMTVEQSAIYMFGAQNSDGYIEVVATEEDVLADDNTFYNALIPPSGKLIIGKELGTRVNVGGSITGGYLYADEIAGVTPAAKNGKISHTDYKHSLAKALGEKNGNWFQFNELTSADSDTFLLVQGDSLDVVGEYTITKNGGGSYTISFPDLIEGVGAKLSVSNNIEAAKNAKSAKANSIWTASPGQQQFSFGGNSFTFDALWVDDSKPVYVYLHLDGLTGYADTFGVEAGTTFTVKVTGPSYPNGEEFEIPMNSSIELSGLKPGEYTVRENESGWSATYFVNGDTDGVEAASVTVTVLNGENTTVRIKNVPGVNASGTFSIQKMAEGEDGYYYPAEGFLFSAYADIADGAPSGDPVATAVSDFAGAAKFESADIVPGKTYFIFEDMTDEQSALYMFGTQNPNGYITVIANETDTGFIGATFYNDLKLGSVSGTKYRVYGSNTSGAIVNETLEGWPVTISGENLPDGYATTVYTDKNGAYTFDDLPFGAYTVTEATPGGWLVADVSSHTVKIGLADADGIDVTGIDFYNRMWTPSGSVSSATADYIQYKGPLHNNHFGYIEAAVDDLKNGVDNTVLAVGNKAVAIGTLSYLLVGNKLTITARLNDGNYFGDLNINNEFHVDVKTASADLSHSHATWKDPKITPADDGSTLSVTVELSDELIEAETLYIYVHVNGQEIYSDNGVYTPPAE